MAMTATLAADREVAAAGQPVTLRATVSNSGAEAVDVVAIHPIAPLDLPVSPASRPYPPLPASVPAGGSVLFSWSVVPFGPQGPLAPQFECALGVKVECADEDETVLIPTAVAVTAHSVFDDPFGLRFDSRLNSGLAAAL